MNVNIVFKESFLTLYILFAVKFVFVNSFVYSSVRLIGSFKSAEHNWLNPYLIILIGSIVGFQVVILIYKKPGIVFIVALHVDWLFIILHEYWLISFISLYNVTFVS